MFIFCLIILLLFCSFALHIYYIEIIRIDGSKLTTFELYQPVLANAALVIMVILTFDISLKNWVKEGLSVTAPYKTLPFDVISYESFPDGTKNPIWIAVDDEHGNRYAKCVSYRCENSNADTIALPTKIKEQK